MRFTLITLFFSVLASTWAGEQPAAPDFSVYRQTEEIMSALEVHTNSASQLRSDSLLVMTEFFDSGYGRIESRVTESGKRCTFSEAQSFARYPSRSGLLSPVELSTLKSAIQKLPATNASPALGRLVILSFRQGTNWVTRTFDSASFPKAMTQVHAHTRVPWARGVTVQ